MTLRARLVLALLVLFAAGMAVYGVASYRAFERSELARLDEQVRATVPVAEREVRLAVDGILIDRHGHRGRLGATTAYPQVVIAPGTYAELRGRDGARLEPAIQVADAEVQPDLSGAGRPAHGAMWTAPSVEGDVEWRVAAERLADGRTMLVAVPMTSVELSLIHI